MSSHGGIYVHQGIGKQTVAGGRVVNRWGADDSFTVETFESGVPVAVATSHHVEFAADGGLVRLTVGDQTFEAAECKLQCEVTLPDGRKVTVPYRGEVNVSSTASSRLTVKAVNGSMTANVHGNVETIEARNGSVSVNADGRVGTVIAHNGDVKIRGSVDSARASVGDVIVQ